MTATAIIILVLAYGVGAAICLMVGLVIGAAARRPEERHEYENDVPPVRIKMWMGERGE
jgi:hypothetical protein